MVISKNYQPIRFCKFINNLNLTKHLNKIKFENRYINNIGNRCLITLDATDVRINEPIPFDEQFYSQKFEDPGLKYEVGVCI